MVQKVARYTTIDGREFVDYSEAVRHEQSLKLIEDVRATVVDVITSTLDPKGRQVYNMDLSQASAFADMLVTTDLLERLKPLLKK